jgi:hypothetical protein
MPHDQSPMAIAIKGRRPVRGVEARFLKRVLRLLVERFLLDVAARVTWRGIGHSLASYDAWGL